MSEGSGFCVFLMVSVFLVLDSYMFVICVLNLHSPRCMSDWSMFLGLGMKDNPLDNILHSAVVRVWLERLTIFLVCLVCLFVVLSFFLCCLFLDLFLKTIRTGRGGLVVRGLVPFLCFLLCLGFFPVLAIVGGRVVLGLVPWLGVPYTLGLGFGSFVGVEAGL